MEAERNKAACARLGYATSSSLCAGQLCQRKESECAAANEINICKIDRDVSECNSCDELCAGKTAVANQRAVCRAADD